MKLLYTLIILFAFSFAEDIYPTFADVEKQEQFGRKKISIQETKNVFSFLGLTNRYKYYQGFNRIKAVELLALCGYNNEAENIVKKRKLHLYSDLFFITLHLANISSLENGKVFGIKANNGIVSTVGTIGGLGFIYGVFDLGYALVTDGTSSEKMIEISESYNRQVYKEIQAQP